MRNEDISLFEKELVDRFISYVKTETTSCEENGGKVSPTTEGQTQLVKMIAAELKAMGVKDARVDRNGYLRAFLPGNAGEDEKTFGFISHADTSPEVSGKDVKPVIHRRYKGNPIKLKGNVIISPEDFPLLLKYRGETLITADGTTLLGADDKAGIAEILTAVSWFMAHPEVKRNSMEIFITPDEEIGMGTDRFPLKKITSDYIYTVDGDTEGCIEAECFNAYRASVSIKGVSIHPGTARGKMVNAAFLGSRLISMLPAHEVPESTDGREGYFCVTSFRGDIESCEIVFILRDFDTAGMERRIKIMEQAGETLKSIYPETEINLEFSCSYSNMYEYIRDNRKCLDLLEKAVSDSGIEFSYKLIRGGTDGARLSELGYPCPNIFTGGQNFHGKKEWVAVPAMLRAVDVIINLVRSGV